MNTADGKGLTLSGINKRFGDVQALRDVELEVKNGEFLTLLGPSGCGKTTLLRIIAGLEMADKGRILLGGQDVSALPANKRNVNTVFQSYALFPHLTVYENVAFGLRSRKIGKSEVDQKVVNGLNMLQIESLADRRPDSLSGGQRQRVALARALVNEPDVLLLDEPMSALDAKLRAQVQVELRQLHQRLGKTFVLVTHDQDEALTVSDRIAVMNNASIIQSGTGRDVYERPVNRFVAEFLGTANIINARRNGTGVETDLGHLTMLEVPPWREGLLAIRPERLRPCDDCPKENGFRFTVKQSVYRGDHLELWLEPGPMKMRVAPHHRVDAGESLWVELPPEGLVALNE